MQKDIEYLTPASQTSGSLEVKVEMTLWPAAVVCVKSSRDRLGLSAFPSLIDHLESRVVYTRELLNVLTGEEDATASPRWGEEAYFLRPCHS